MPDFRNIDPEAHYTAKEAAALRAVAVDTVLTAIRRGYLPAVREGGSYLIAGRALRSWRRVPPKPSPRAPRTRPNIPPGFLTVAEAAELVGRTRAAAYLAISAGRLPARRVNGQLVVAEDDAIAWLEGRA